MTERTERMAMVCRDGEKRTVEISRVSTPIGEMIVRLCPVGLHMISQSGEITDENFVPDPRKEVTLLSEPLKDERAGVCLSKCMAWLSSYFHIAKDVSQLRIPPLCTLAPGSSRFRDKVLLCLTNAVPVGKTITYGELASLAGSPGAQQAVGSAMAANPFQLLVPCHRVVKSGQKIGKYSGGCRNLVKMWLLQHEGFSIDKDGTVHQM